MSACCWFVSDSTPFSIMELLILEFLNFLPLNFSVIKELKHSIESSKGIYSLYISYFPYWTTTIISSDYLSLNQINKFIRSSNLGDLIAVIGSIDFVLGSVDLVVRNSKISMNNKTFSLQFYYSLRPLPLDFLVYLLLFITKSFSLHLFYSHTSIKR